MSISTTGTAGSPATDLARLLHRPPDEVRRAATAYGEAHVFFPEADDERCTAVLLLEGGTADPARRGRGGGRTAARPGAVAGEADDDRGYAVSSRFAAALRIVFRAAMEDSGADGRTLPLRIELPAVRVDGGSGADGGAVGSGGAALARRLFEPLGWRVEAAAIPLDEEFPEWGESPFVRLGLEASAVRPADALWQLAVLLPVLDGATDGPVVPEGVEKLLADGGGWPAGHPERELIARRLARRDPVGPDGGPECVGEPADEPVAAVLAALREVRADRVVHLGCGRGGLLAALLAEGRFTELLGVDTSLRALSDAADRLGLDRTPEPAPEWAATGHTAGRTTRRTTRVRLVQGAPMYADARLKGFDAAVLDAGPLLRADPVRRQALEHTVFGAVRPAAVVVTARTGGPGLRSWAERAATAHGYTVTVTGPAGPALFRRGTPTPGGGEPR
ncbi:3' terminal RNA ribose 2'-O-methyltransferase Hen1 [Kitasatospora sp. NBC_00458]|uniref:3' terminal RNA ribose 2'-O-methyltransferase Hen1 n=1 Tax=Kitasatospora sp. NBC_00458 TaxID=2903568 RepID=UPI002E17C298